MSLETFIPHVGDDGIGPNDGDYPIDQVLKKYPHSIVIPANTAGEIRHLKYTTDGIDGGDATIRFYGIGDVEVSPTKFRKLLPTSRLGERLEMRFQPGDKVRVFDNSCLREVGRVLGERDYDNWSYTFSYSVCTCGSCDDFFGDIAVPPSLLERVSNSESD